MSMIETGNCSSPCDEMGSQSDTLAHRAQVGDIVTVELDLTPEDGFVPERLFDTHGQVSFVLGWGNYLPGLHEILTGMRIGEAVQNVSIDAGWGERSRDMVIEVPKSNLKKLKSIDSIEVDAILNLQGGIKVTVVKVTENTITVDANHPMAGSSYSCSLKVLNVEAAPISKLGNRSDECSPEQASSSPYEVATWALGCFWGGELAFMRTPGVVGAKVGYTQGIKLDPTYEEVCLGNTQHREAVMVIYDPRVVSYKELLVVYMERLAATTSQYKIELFKEEYSSKQYMHGIYFHNDEQLCSAQEAIDSNNNFYQVELKKAATFYDAENYHQQYLLKGGQSARKSAKETIRCFG
jgi:peptide-methionine (S)-S-oxide reductase